MKNQLLKPKIQNGSNRIIFFITLSLILFLVYVNAADAAEASIKVTQNAIIKGNLMMQVQAEELFTEKVIKFLDRGFTIRLDYRIELWKRRPFWFDSLESQHNISYQISFDPLEKRYVSHKSQEGTAVSSKIDKQQDKIIEWATQTEPPLNIISVEQLDQTARYYYNIEITVSTLTTENIKDLQRWLGEFDEKEEESSTVTKTVFKVAADFISSRNNKKLSARSKQFYLRELPEINK